MSLLDSGPLAAILSRVLTESRREKLRLALRNANGVWRQFRQNLSGMVGLWMLAFFLGMAVFAPLLATHEDPDDLRWAEINPANDPPSFDFVFGTDRMGRDVWSLTVWGSRASLIVGVVASVISIVIGTLIGVSAGYFGRITDELLMRLTDFFLVLPWFPLMIVFASLMGRSFTNVIIVIGITSWPSTARIVRAQVLSIREKGFVERARAIGAGDAHIIRKHIAPNVFPLIFANTILLIANAIFSESFLSFFGLGDPDVITWGTMLEEAYNWGAFTSLAWWIILAPGGCIVLLIMAFYLLGDALDEVLNPKLRRR